MELSLEVVPFTKLESQYIRNNGHGLNIIRGTIQRRI